VQELAGFFERRASLYQVEVGGSVPLHEKFQTQAATDQFLTGATTGPPSAYSAIVAGFLSKRKQVSKHKSIALDHDSRPYCDGPGEHRRVIYERVKFPVLAAWIDSGR
jgi:hypothetical protein